MNENAAKLKELLADEAFFMSLIEAENEEAVQKKLADKGVEMSLTEIELMKEMVGAVANGKLTVEDLDKISKMDELSDEELEQAAGGDIGASIYNFFHTQAKTTGAGGIASYGDVFLNKGRVAGAVGVGVAAVGAAAYGIYSFKDEIASGAKDAYGWVSDNITRW